MLEFASGSLALPQAGMLLRSPFLGGAGTEWTKRAQLDAKLRRDGVWDVSPALLRDRAENCPLLERLLRKFEKQRRQLFPQQPASEWSRDFSELLEALGWPGDRTLSSREYQVVEKWHGLLSSLATLDAALPPISFAQALSRLQEIAAALPFQVENEGAPIQIMGLLEASGLRFDHLWIMGLHDEALPAAANPNPFLPISMQREHQLPHSSAERELEFAVKLMDRLLQSSRAYRVELSGDGGGSNAWDRVRWWLLDGGWSLVRALRNLSGCEKCAASVEIQELHDEICTAGRGGFHATGRCIAIQGYGGLPVSGIRQASAGRTATGGNRSGGEQERSGQRGSPDHGSYSGANSGRSRD